MTYQFSDTVANAALDAIETATGTAPTLEIRTGSAPANCAAADSGTLLASITLPSDWMAAASGRSKAKAGTWAVDATGDGTAGHFRIKKSGVVHIQGPVTQGSSTVTGELVIINTDIATGQPVTVSAFDLTGPAA